MVQKVYQANIANKPHKFGFLIPSNYQPYPKNPDIARIFTQIGYSEELGTGIINVFKFSEPYSNSTKIIFKDDDIFITEVPLKVIFKNVPVNNRQKQIINDIKLDKQYTQTELAKKHNVNKETIKRDFKKLKELNIIKRIGSDKTGYWKIIKK